VTVAEPSVMPMATGPGGREVRLLEAREPGLDERGLRRWARAQTFAGARCVSRSYRHPYGLVAWHDQPVGIDIERIEQFDPALLESICTPSERSLPVDELDPARYATSVWCSKEALSKALGDALRYDPRRLGSPLFWPGGRSGPWRARSLPAPPGHTAWLCWRAAAG